MATIDWQALTAIQKLNIANGVGSIGSGISGGAGGSGGGYSGTYLGSGGFYNPNAILGDSYLSKVGKKPDIVVDSRVGRLEVPMEDGSTEYVDPAELVKYIRERKLRSENEIVQTQWDRYQVAVKIVGSTDNGQEDEE